MSQAKEFLSSLGMDEQNQDLKRKREEETIIPLHLRPRKLNFWDQRPKGYDKMSADQIKATGMFLLPSHLLKGTGKVEPVQPYGMIGYQQPVVVEKKSGFNTKRLIITNLPECQEDDLIGWVNMTYDTNEWDKGPGLPGLACHIDAEKHTAIVEFRSPEEATEALKLNGMEFMESTITVLRPKDYRAGEEDPNYVPGVVGTIVADTTNKVFIGGLPTYVTDDQVMDLLKAFGVLKSFCLSKNDAGVSKGFAFCEYLDSDITDLACEGLHGLELGDKKLIVQRAHTGISKMPVMEGALPGVGLGRPILPIEILGANGLKAAEPTCVLMMANVFDPELVAKDDVYEDVLEDIRLECERFGSVEEMYIPRPEKDKSDFLSGRAYCKFSSKEECQKAQRALAGRKFLDRTVLTTFVDPYKFEARPKQMVWNSNYKIIINRSPLEIYTNYIAKPKEWPVWDTDIAKVEMEQEFKDGAKGKLYMKKMSSPFDFELQNCDPGKNMEYVTKLPGTVLVWYWKLAPSGDGSAMELDMGVKSTGFLSGLYKLIMKKECDKAFVECTKNLKELAEK